MCNVIPDAVSRNKHVPNDLVHDCTIKISASSSIQLDADLHRNIVINETHLSHD